MNQVWTEMSFCRSRIHYPNETAAIPRPVKDCATAGVLDTDDGARFTVYTKVAHGSCFGRLGLSALLERARQSAGR